MINNILRKVVLFIIISLIYLAIRMVFPCLQLNYICYTIGWVLSSITTDLFL